jgi:acyl-ACP thioesterase
MLIDLSSRRPVNVEPFLTHYSKTNPDRSLIIDRDDKLATVEQIDNTVFFNVRYGDLDLNNHVNNVHFMEWMLEAVPQPYRESRLVQTLDIQFRSECFYGDRIRSVIQQTSENSIIHELRRESDNKEVARAMSVWR